MSSRVPRKPTATFPPPRKRTAPSTYVPTTPQDAEVRLGFVRQERDAAAAQRDLYARALVRYAQHERGCAPAAGCSCGLGDVLDLAGYHAGQGT